MTHTDRNNHIVRLVSRTGVTLFGMRFTSAEFRDLWHGGRARKVQVEFLIDDLREIRVSIVGGPILKLSVKALKDVEEPVTVDEWIAARASLSAHVVG